MNMSQSMDRKTFLANLRHSRLLTEEQLAEAVRLLPSSRLGRDVARALVRQEVLTPFQAERLLAGRNTGFVLGPYRILDPLGRGGMGRVFRAEHRTMKRVVALKVLAPKLLQSQRARALFSREMQAASQIVHPNVVAAFDAGEEAGHCFLVLEYVDGPNLGQLVRRQGPLAFGLACDYIKQAAHGLQAAHALGMVHRDIKPSNLLVQRCEKDGVPGLLKINDFGLARLNTPGSGGEAGTILVQQNTVMGTPDFLSPEQARDVHAADIRSDLYSLGCTFYYLLSGQAPFPGGTPLEKLLRHSAEEPASLAGCRPDVPAEVLAIVQRLLCKARERRFQTPRELAEALEPYAAGGPTPWAASPPLSSPELEATESAPPRSLLDGHSSDEWAAMTGTAPDLAPTRITAPDRPAAARPRRLSRRDRRLLTCFAGAAVALLAVLALLMALLQ